MSASFSINGGFCCNLAYAELDTYSWSSNTVSNEALSAQTVVNSVVESARLPQSIFGEKEKAISQLMTMVKECAEEDMYEVIIDPIALSNTIAFIRAMPDTLPMPEFTLDPDGAVSLDWFQSQYRLFSLSISSSNRLAYSWLDGTDKGHGVAGFDHGDVPLKVREGIRSIMNGENAHLRIA